uniref:Reverse transcriptase domain-containing protein n=1 Tax=Tanacetum cinerariifolium TaxID=118510 RepID=A0A6L2K2P9_TANCI|nr:hypothetical protein [Tanacetum cinerariifolium]
MAYVVIHPQESPEVIPFIESKEWIETKNELYKMMEAYTKRTNQQREQEVLLAAQREQELREQEQAAQREQDLLVQKQAAQEKEQPPQNSDFQEEIRLVENFSYDNSSPRPPEELNAEIADTILESLSLSLIPVEDNDSYMEEIDLFLATDDLMPPGIENDNYDSKGISIFLKDCLAMIHFPFPKMSHLTLIIMMICHFLVLLWNHQMLRFSLILSPIRVF